HSAKRFKINMISAITNTGKSMFSLYDESIKIDSFIEFCKKVIAYAGTIRTASRFTSGHSAGVDSDS
ncbi:hypothetical protein, partial [Aliarcobacter cryaerophilus]